MPSKLCLTCTTLQHCWRQMVMKTNYNKSAVPPLRLEQPPKLSTLLSTELRDATENTQNKCLETLSTYLFGERCRRPLSFLFCFCNFVLLLSFCLSLPHYISLIRSPPPLLPLVCHCVSVGITIQG